MIGNGRRGAGDRNRDLEEDDELESREERGSESGGGGGGFGGWRSHLLGGLTQRVKSWYWGARPLVSFPIHCEKKNRNLFLSYSWYARFRFISLLPSSPLPPPFSPFRFIPHRPPSGTSLRHWLAKGWEDKGARGRGRKMDREGHLRSSRRKLSLILLEDTSFPFLYVP